MSEGLKIPDEISADFTDALKTVEDDGKCAVALLVDVMLGGLKAEMPHGVGGTLPNFAVRLNYVKAWAEWCHYVKPTPAEGGNKNLTDDEIIQLFEAATSKGSPESQPD